MGWVRRQIAVYCLWLWTLKATAGLSLFLCAYLGVLSIFLWAAILDEGPSF